MADDYLREINTYGMSTKETVPLTNSEKNVACVTGASGIIGFRIVSLLNQKGYQVRVLRHKKAVDVSSNEVFKGSLNDKPSLEPFLADARLVFHCAAEISDFSKMWSVNVEGTRALFDMAKKAGIKFFVHMSSAGVSGPDHEGWVNENSPCRPDNLYEKSKYAAEEVVSEGIKGGQVAILRPTNVLDNRKPGVFNYITGKTLKCQLIKFVKGNECTHIIHASDVAAAAVYIVQKTESPIDCYFISLDHEPLNTLSGLQALYYEIKCKGSSDYAHSGFALPPAIPHLVRKMIRGHSLHGSVRFSSEKLMKTGFKFPLGLKGTVKSLMEENQQRR